MLDAAGIVERVRAAGLLFEPGSERLYSSAGYTCLARLIEVVEGKPFAAVLAEKVFSPAGMTSAVSETGQGLMPRRGAPYRLGSDGRQVVVKRAPYKDLRFLTGAGSVYATAEDLQRFVQAVCAGSFGQDLAEEAFAGDPEAWQGWAARTNGYEGWVDVLPAEDLTLVFLCNLQSAANWQLREQIHNVLVGRPARSTPSSPSEAGDRRASWPDRLTDEARRNGTDNAGRGRQPPRRRWSGACCRPSRCSSVFRDPAADRSGRLRGSAAAAIRAALTRSRPPYHTSRSTCTMLSPITLAMSASAYSCATSQRKMFFEPSVGFSMPRT